VNETVIIEQEKKFQLNRRNFLKAGVAASTIGLIGAIKAPSKVAYAAGESLKYTAAARGNGQNFVPNMTTAVRQYVL
jgi:hypothetical protein